MARAARIAAPRAAVELVEHDVPAPGPGEVLVRSHAAGICGSDVSMLAGTRPAGFTRYPVIPGHEWSGRVVETGAGVDGLTAGQPVACMSLQWCGACERCRDGQTQLCQRGYSEVGFTTPGGLSELVVIDARQALPLPATIGLDEAALLEPTAVVCHAFGRCPPLAGRTLTVIGDGTLGLLAVQVARAAGAAVALVGLDDRRLQLATQLGTGRVYQIRPGDPRPSGLPPADVVVECAGAPGSLLVALHCARRGGTVAVLGVTGGDAQPSIAGDRFVVDDLTVTGILASTPASWNHALRLAATEAVRLGPLITHRFGLDQVADAFEHATKRPPGAVKVLIVHNHKESKRE